MDSETHFSGAAAEYQEKSLKLPWRWLRQREASVLLQMLHPQRGETILDAGCGAGYYAELLLDQGAEVTGLDLSRDMLQEVEARLGIPTIHGDLVGAELENRYDKILCAGALEFLTHEQAAQALSNLAGGLRPGGAGVLALLLPRPSVGGAIYRSYHQRHGVEVSLFSREWVEKAAAQAGLVVQEMRRVTLNCAVRLEPRSADSA